MLLAILLLIYILICIASLHMLNELRVKGIVFIMWSITPVLNIAMLFAIIYIYKLRA